MGDPNMNMLGDLIRAFYHEKNRDNALAEQKILDSWEDVVGSFIASHTVKTSLTNGVLYVKVDADSLRSELIFSKSVIFEKLNNCAGSEILKDIIIR